MRQLSDTEVQDQVLEGIQDAFQITSRQYVDERMSIALVEGEAQEKLSQGNDEWFEGATALYVTVEFNTAINVAGDGGFSITFRFAPEMRGEGDKAQEIMQCKIVDYEAKWVVIPDH
jgi:hypothetical protein